MAEALNDPERELDMWQFDASSSSTQQHMQLSVIGLDKTYSTSEKIEFEIKVKDIKEVRAKAEDLDLVDNGEVSIGGVKFILN